MTLVELLERWRATRDPRLAALVEHHGARLACDETSAIALLKPAAKGAALIAALGAARAETITPLVEAIDTFARTTRFSWPVIEILDELPADPRIAGFALALLRDFGTLKHTSAKLWRRLVDVVESHGDRGTAEALAALELAPKVTNDAVATRRANVVKRLQARGAPIDGAELAAIAQAMATAGAGAIAKAAATDGDALLAAIHADPTELAARAVYADWLGANGDPRGEFVVLQLQRLAGATTPEGDKRERALLDKHARTWLAPLVPVLAKEREPTLATIPGELVVGQGPLAGVGFAGGFVVRVPALAVPSHRRAIYDDPLWATVQVAERVNGFSAVMRSLRHAVTGGGGLATLPALEHELESLEVTGYATSAKQLANARRVVALRLTAGPPTGNIWQSLHAVADDNPTIVSIETPGYKATWHEHALAEHLAPLGPRLSRIRITDHLTGIELRRGAGGAWDQVTLWTYGRDDLRDALAPFGPGGLATLHVVARQPIALDDEVARIARHVTVEVDDLTR